MTLPAPRFFMLRVRRDGPLVPAKFWWCDHAPGEPDNKLDRGRLSVYPRAEIAGEEAFPEVLFARLGIWPFNGDVPAQPDQILARLITAEPPPISHWKHAQTITKTEFRYQTARLRWAQRQKPDDPIAQPRQPINPAQLTLPNFDKENRSAADDHAH